MLTDKNIEIILQRYFKGGLSEEEKERLFASLKSDPALNDIVLELLRNTNQGDVERFLSEKSLMEATSTISEKDETLIELYFSGMLEPEEETEFKEKLSRDENLCTNALARAFLSKAIERIRKSDEQAIESARELPTSAITILFDEFKDERDDELIDSFLKGTLSESEVGDFKARIGTDAKFKERVSAMAMLNKGIKEQQAQTELAINDARTLTRTDIEKAIVASRANVADQYPRSVTRSSVFTLRRIAAVAIIAIVFAGVGFDYYNYSQVPEIASRSMASLQVDYKEAPSRGGDDDIYAELQLLFGTIEPGSDVKEAIARLEVYYKTSTDEYADIEDDYADQISFALATAYLYDGQRAKAKEILNHIMEDDDASADIKGKADELLKAMKKSFLF